MYNNNAGFPASSRGVRILCAGFALAALCFSRTGYARAWHSAKSDQTLEGDFIGLDRGIVSIRNAEGKLFTVKLTQLSGEDQKYVTKQVASGAKPPPARLLTPPAKPPAPRPDPPSAKGAATRMVSCPLTIEVSPMTGTGSERKAAYVLKNAGSKTIKSFNLHFLYLKSDGSVGDSSPYTEWCSENALAKGLSTTNEVNSFFMEPDTVGVDAIVTGITYVDDSEWPVVPASPPQNGSEPVTGLVVGILGKGLCSEPLVACFNYDDREVQAVNYKILYLDADGKTVGETGYGMGSGESLMKKGSGITVSGGAAPPQGAVDAQVKITSVKFVGGTTWEPGT